MRNHRFFRHCLKLAAALVFIAVPYGDTLAQAFPSRPITMLFPFPAGTATEAAYRLINAEASKILGQPVVIEIRPGANARLGVTAVRNAPGDGYLLAIVNDSIVVSQPIADPGFKLESGKDYVPVGLQFEFPLALYARPTLPFRDLKGLIGYAKANPGKLNFATSPTTQFPAELLRQAADIQVTYIPYKGAEMMLDMAAGRIDATITGATGKPFVDSGKILALATTGNQRWEPFPNVPTLAEAGVPVEYTVWFGLVAAPGTSTVVIAKLNDAFNVAIKSPDVLKAFKSYGYVAASRATTSKEFSAFIQSQFGVWEPVIRKSGMRIN